MTRKKNTHPGVERHGKSWRARYYDPSGKQRAKSFKTAEEARKFKVQMEQAVQAGSWLDPSRSQISFEEWSNLWLSSKTNLAPKTINGYKQSLRTHLLPRFGRTPLRGISRLEIETWIADSANSNTGKVAIKNALVLLKGILESAVRDDRIAKNPARGIKPPKTVRKEIVPLTRIELQKLAHFSGEYRVLVLIAGTMGLRIGEILALKTQDVNLFKKVIHVNKAVQEDQNRKPVVGPTKTHAIRDVPIPDFLIEDLKSILINKSVDEFLFTGERGTC